MLKFPRAAFAASLFFMAVVVAGCSGGGLGLSNEVIVRNDADPYNLDASQRIADAECAARGAGRAQYFFTQNNARSGSGHGGGGTWGPPELLYRCAPAGGAR
jgi:hypothetical protein